MFRRVVQRFGVVVVFFCNGVIAQDLDENNFIRYTNLQGLSNNYVSGIVQDSIGYIWIATHKGLNRFDGKVFQTLYKSSSNSPLPDNHLVSLHAQSSTEILGSTRAGAFAYDPIKGTYKKFIVTCDSTIFFWTNHVLDMVKDKNSNYIISTKTGLYIFNKTARLIRRYDHHTKNDVGRSEMIFGGWVSLLSNGTTLQQNGLLGSVYDPVSNSIDTDYIAQHPYLKKQISDSSGNMKIAWTGHHDELFILNRNKNTIDVAGINPSMYNSAPLPFKVGEELGWSSKLGYINDSLLTITGRSSGFFFLHYNRRTHELTSNGKKYFESNRCTSVFEDKEGRLWVGTTDGLFKQNLHDAFFSVTDISRQSPSLINEEIRSIYVEGDLIIAGLQNGGGLLLLDKATGAITKQIMFEPRSLFDNTIINIVPYCADTLWVGTNRGIVWFSTKSLRYGKVKVPPQLDWMDNINPNLMFEDSQKDIWIAFGKLNSLIRFNRSDQSFTDLSPPANPLLKLTYIFSIAEDLQGNIWLAGDGLCRWSRKKQLVDTLIPYPKVSKLLRNYMLILDRDGKNNLWLSSFDNEIIQYNCTTNKMYLRQQEDTIIDGNTVTASPIIDNNIWMGTDNGISAFNIADYSVKQFTYADGLPSVSVSSIRKGSFYDKLSNRFYLGAKHRLISFIPDLSLSHKMIPSLFIEKLVARDSTIIYTGEHIHLESYFNNVNIFFNTLNFTDPEENRYAWRSLTTRDTSWNELNNQTSLYLPNLDEGWHIIQVSLFSVNNHWPCQTQTIRIHIMPPFWRTTWFKALMATITACIILIIYNNRVDAVRKKERENAKVQQLIAEEYKNRLELEQISHYFSSSLVGKNDVNEVLWDVTKNLIGRMDYEDCIIYLWNKDKSRMVQKAAYGPKGDMEVINAQAFDVSPGQGVVGTVMQTKEPILVADTRKDKRYRVDDMPRLSELCVPIIHNNELIGIIDSEHPEENHFQERDIKILTTIATLVGNKMKQIESEQLLEVKQKEIGFINQQLAEAQLSALQTQMNPHFIFNSLNSIKGMILADEQQKASRYLSKFALMIRITLKQSKEIFTTLYENIEHLESYLLMEKLRFDDSFTFSCSVDDSIDIEEMMIPTLMLQPLAENAIWHGLMHTKGGKKLTIRFSREGETISCTIEDNGIGIKESLRLKQVNKSSYQSVGLTNLRNRIKILNEKYDMGCTLDINDLSDADSSRTGTNAVLNFHIITNKPFL